MGKLRKLRHEAHKLARQYRVDKPSSFRLKQIDPGDTAGLEEGDKASEKQDREDDLRAMSRLQDILYAQDRWALLLIFQAMDAAGKDSAIKHVMSGVNPQGCQVTSFKVPSAEELDHDYLWRCSKQLPERGRIGIFNRSYYEEVLVVRVHPELLAKQKLPPELVTKDIWKRRFRDIRAWERHLSGSGVVIRKFFLHVSLEEQKRRFLERIENPAKNWKFSAQDAGERALWKQYMAAYEEMIRETSTEESPWFAVPADNKWFTRKVVAAAVIDAMASLDLCYPELSKVQLAELAKAKRELLG
ncbi:MAG: polyphosphate kinase 2 family protein [Acidobacteriota bacterium]